MNLPLFYTLFVSTAILYIYIAYKTKPKNTMQDYFLADRSLTFWPLTLTLLATQIGGGSIIGTSNQAYHVGYLAMFYNLGMALGFLCLGLFFAKKMWVFKIDTISELFDTRFKSKNLQKIASIIFSMSLFGIFVGQIVASKNLTASLGINELYLQVLIWGSLIYYTMKGGFKAVVITDMFQISIVVLFLIGLSVYMFVGLPVEFPVMWKPEWNTSEGVNLSPWEILILPLMFSLIEQDLAQRFFAAKTPQISSKAALVSALVLVLFSLIPVSLGIMARALEVEVLPHSSVLMTLVETKIGAAGSAILFFILLAAICSTANSLLCAVSSNFVKDFNLKTSPSVVTLIIGVLGFFFALYLDHVLFILIKSYALPVCTLFVPIILCFFVKPNSKWISVKGAYLSIVFGAVTFGLGSFSELIVGLVEVKALVASLLGYLIGVGLRRG